MRIHLSRSVAAVGRGLVMGGLGVIQLPIAVAAFAGLVTQLVGLVFLFMPAVRLSRWWTRLARRVTRTMTGVAVSDPYRPPPPSPRPQPDGWYRDGNQLYRTPRVPSFNRRLDWMLKDPATWRDFLWLITYPLSTALIACLPAAALGYGLAAVAGAVPGGALGGLVLAALGVLAAPYVLRAVGLSVAGLLGPTARTMLAQRVRHLAETRTEAVDAQAAELRRIERDLHDGAQARLVAVGMTIGAAEQLLDTDPSAAVALIDKAQEASAAALEELRRLVRGIRPPVLVERGLVEALRALAVESPLAVTVTHSGVGRCHSAVESAVYFAVTELLTNAVRHGRARRARVELRRDGDQMVVTVTDDGVGGADPGKGSGLRGIERRLMPFDGELELDSPPGGPTTVTLRLTCTPPESGEDGGASAGERRADRDFATDAAQAAPDSPRSPAASASRAKAAPSWRHDVSNLCWGLFAVPLVPLGLIPAALNAAGVPVPLPGWAIIALIVIGGQMLVYALVMLMQSVKERDSESADESRHR